MANGPRRTTSRRRRSGIQWGSFGTGLVLGIALTLTGALVPELLEDTDAPAPAKSASSPAPATPRFEFFDSLPRGDVSVNTKPYEKLTPKAGADPVEYLLQVGSFSTRDDAERLRASVLLTGLDARTTQAKLPSGAVAHRVIVGPFDHEQEMRRAMTKLREQNINPLLLARKPGAA